MIYNTLEYNLLTYNFENNFIINFILNNYSIIFNILSLFFFSIVLIYFLTFIHLSKGGQVLDNLAKLSQIVIAATSVYAVANLPSNNNNNKDEDDNKYNKKDQEPKNTNNNPNPNNNNPGSSSNTNTNK